MSRNSCLARLGTQSILRLPLAVTLLFLPLVLSVSEEVKAVAPSCVTNAAGSKSCNVGVNPVPTFVSLDGGYQWLTEEVETTSVSGTKITETVPVFTATQTNYLDVVSVTVTNNGATSTTVQTEYLSWITATPTSNGGGAGTAVIAGVIIAPALIATVQKVADGASGKTVSQIADDLRSAFKTSKILLTPGDVQGLAVFIGAAVAANGAKVIISVYWTGPTAPLTATVTGSPTSSSSSSSSSGRVGAAKSTHDVDTTAGPTVTAIMKLPYDDWQAILGLGMPPAEPETESKTQCSKGGEAGTDPETANELAAKFCTGSKLDFSKDQSKTLGGSDLSPSVDLEGVSIQFGYKHDTGKCSLNCTASYSSIIAHCQYDDHDISGSANITDGCGTYGLAMVSSTAAAAPTSTAASGPRPTYAQVCTPHSGANVAFPRDTGADAINRSWSRAPNSPSGLTIPPPDLSIIESMGGHFIFHGNVNWSKNQNGCNAKKSDYEISQDVWNTLFTTAMDNCDTDSKSAKYGAMPLTWNSPSGCIDVNFWATAG